MTILRVLIIEDNENDSILVQETLRNGGYDVRALRVETEEDLRHALQNKQWDIVLSDYSLPSFDAQGTLSVLKETGYDIPVIVVSGTVGEEVAVETLKLGAEDYLLKQNLTRLVPAVAHALDVAENRRLHRKLEHMQNIILENSLDLICTFDTQGRFLELSAAAQAVLGCEPAELTGIHFEKLVHPDDLALLRNVFQAVLQGRRIRDFECRFIHQSGQTVSLTWSAALSRDNGVIVGVGRDITERKQKDEALRRIEDNIRRERALLRTLIDSIPDLVFFKDKSFAYLGCNRACENYLGISESQLIGKTDFDIMPAEFAPYYRSQDEKLYASGQPRRIEEEVLSGNGRIGIFETIKSPFYGPDGELLGLLGVSRDITERKQMEEALREERDYSDAILNSLPGVFYHYDDNLRLLRWNRNLERISGYSAEELAGITPLAFLVEEEKALVASRIKEVFEQGESQVEADYLLKDGRRIPYLFTGVRFEHNGRQGFVGVGTDIEEHKRMEEALREKTALFEAQVESSPDGILVIDRHGRKLIQNERLNKMWLLPPDIAANRNYLPQIEFAAQRTKNPTEFIAKIAWLEAHPEEVSHDEIELVDGTVLARYSAPVFDKEGHYYGRTWIHSDITDRRQAEQHIRYLATHDDLTALPNRNLIQDRIVQAIVHARRTDGHLALLYLDLDRFKVINDGYGHPFGDAVLKAAAERLVALVRDGDTVARLGGDEFLILLTDLHAAADAYLVAKKIVESLDCPVEVQERVVHLSSSIGVSVFPHDGETADALIDNADVAMYRAKELGRNTCQFFTREMSEETQRRVDLETRLRGAAAAGQLQLAYQPKVDLESGCITGCEALLRWSHPELGIVSPSRFIPIAEDSGLIVPIGDWVLRAACLQAKAWLDAGLPPVCVAVNISARQFLQQDVVSWVLRTLHETGLPAAQLELELTESLIAQDVGKVITTFGQLRTAGVKLSIDDFGTGYSSLSYLKRFRVDTLKIDQSFVRDMLTDPEDATIVLAVIALAHNLGFKVIAEGVETERHCQVLRENRCDEIQGHYFSKPLPAAEFEAILRSGKRLS